MTDLVSPDIELERQIKQLLFDRAVGNRLVGYTVETAQQIMKLCSAQRQDVSSRLARECIENLNATDDGDPAGNLGYVLVRGFAALGWAQPSLAAAQLIDTICASKPVSSTDAAPPEAEFNNAQEAIDYLDDRAPFPSTSSEEKFVCDFCDRHVFDPCVAWEDAKKCEVPPIARPNCTFPACKCQRDDRCEKAKQRADRVMDAVTSQHRTKGE